MKTLFKFLTLAQFLLLGLQVFVLIPYQKDINWILILIPFIVMAFICCAIGLLCVITMDK